MLSPRFALLRSAIQSPCAELLDFPLPPPLCSWPSSACLCRRFVLPSPAKQSRRLAHPTVASLCPAMAYLIPAAHSRFIPLPCRSELYPCFASHIASGPVVATASNPMAYPFHTLPLLRRSLPPAKLITSLPIEALRCLRPPSSYQTDHCPSIATPFEPMPCPLLNQTVPSRHAALPCCTSQRLL